MPGPSITDLTLSGTIKPQTPTGCTDSDVLAAALGVSNITVLKTYKGQITIADQATILTNSETSANYPSLIIAVVDAPIRFLFQDGAGDPVSISLKKFAVFTIAPPTTPTNFTLILDGRIVTSQSSEIVQGSVVNYYIALCKADLS